MRLTRCCPVGCMNQADILIGFFILPVFNLSLGHLFDIKPSFPSLFKSLHLLRLLSLHLFSFHHLKHSRLLCVQRVLWSHCSVSLWIFGCWKCMASNRGHSWPRGAPECVWGGARFLKKGKTCFREGNYKLQTTGIHLYFCRRKKYRQEKSVGHFYTEKTHNSHIVLGDISFDYVACIISLIMQEYKCFKQSDLFINTFSITNSITKQLCNFKKILNTLLFKFTACWSSNWEEKHIWATVCWIYFSVY